MCMTFKCSKITEITAAIFVPLWKSFTALRCRYCRYYLLPADASAHVSTRCMYLLVGKAQEISSLCTDATEVPWSMFIWSSGCITLLFQLKRLFHITSMTYRPTDKWHDKRRSWTASKVLKGNGLYKHYLQWPFWRYEKVHEHSRDRRWPGEIRTGLIEKHFGSLLLQEPVVYKLKRRDRGPIDAVRTVTFQSRNGQIFCTVCYYECQPTLPNTFKVRDFLEQRHLQTKQHIHWPWTDRGHTHSENWSLI